MAKGRKSGKAESAVVVDVPTVSSSAGVFLGTLRSEFDEPAALPAVFARLLDDVEAVLAEHRNGTLDEHATAAQLSELTLTDADGAQWTLGATTRRWYRRTRGGSWLPTPPPAASGGEVVASFELDEALLSTMTRSAAALNSLDAPSDTFHTLHGQPIVRPASDADVTDAVPLPAGVDSVLELTAPEPAGTVVTRPPAIRDAGDISPADAAPQPDGVAPVLELDAAVAEGARLSPTPGGGTTAVPPVWDAPDEVPPGAVPLPEGLSSTLTFDLPDEFLPAPEPAPEQALMPQRSGVSLTELLSGYTPAPTAVAAPPAAPAAGPDINAILAELRVTAPVAGEDDLDDDLDDDLEVPGRI